LTYNLSYPALSGPDTGKWTFTQTNGSIVSSLIFNSSFFEPFGFFANSTNVFNGTTLISTCVIKLQSEDRLLIHSNIVNNPGVDDVLISINSTTSINYSSIAYECPAPEFYAHLLTSPNNSTYSFSLTNEDGELMQLNGLNLNFTLLFYKRDPIWDQIRNFMKMAVLK
jgi:type 1 fimbria pilin